MTKAAIILAAGKGVRAGGGLPKQWRNLAGQTVIARTLTAFDTHPGIDTLILVIGADEDQPPVSLSTKKPLTITRGGETRTTSVKAGLRAAHSLGATKVLIHDGARPLVSHQIISDVIAALGDSSAAAPALAVTDALWRGADDVVIESVSRDGLFRAQTPQGFNLTDILAAHDMFDEPAFDDVEIARRAGLEVRIVRGCESNLKLTTPEDFTRAEQLLRGKMDIRTGNGFDVHRFGEGASVTLCGVEIPYSRSLQGHSDADVGMHAITDAIYGALAEGDIGQHFPPSDPKWKGAESNIFLKHACALARARGFTLNHVDCTLLCEEPKIGPHALEMRRALAEIMDMDPARISVKATTTERLGFTGRKEGIAASATATLISQ